ncbi:hypothetical protein [Embleya sp. NPDC005971]|uniref:hypothetical protein n=1 Tax=Embleya sp. NPDC005971 TaxID=3156724 RepID=UPI0033D62341
MSRVGLVEARVGLPVDPGVERVADDDLVGAQFGEQFHGLRVGQDLFVGLDHDAVVDEPQLLAQGLLVVGVFALGGQSLGGRDDDVPVVQAQGDDGGVQAFAVEHRLTQDPAVAGLVGPDDAVAQEHARRSGAGLGPLDAEQPDPLRALVDVRDRVRTARRLARGVLRGLLRARGR